MRDREIGSPPCLTRGNITNTALKLASWPSVVAGARQLRVSRVARAAARRALAAGMAQAQAGAPRGAFILFEGVDRSGKSTQATKLVEALNKQGVRVFGCLIADARCVLRRPASVRQKRFASPRALLTWNNNTTVPQTPAELWRFPDRKGTVTGKAINDYLAAPAAAVAAAPAATTAGSAKGQAEAGPSAVALSDQAIHMLFSANRWEKRYVLTGTVVAADC